LDHGHKTKGSIDSPGTDQQMAFDLQSNVYVIAAENDQAISERHRKMIRGVRYNVVKRPAHKSIESMLKSPGGDMPRRDEQMNGFGVVNVEILPHE